MIFSLHDYETGYVTITYCSGEIKTLPTGSCIYNGNIYTGGISYSLYGIYSVSVSGQSIIMTFYTNAQCSTPPQTGSYPLSEGIYYTSSCSSSPINGLTFVTSAGFPFPPTSQAGAISV